MAAPSRAPVKPHNSWKAVSIYVISICKAAPKQFWHLLTAPLAWWWQQVRESFARGIAIFIAAIAVVFFGSAALLRVTSPKPELMVSTFEVSGPIVNSLKLDGKSLTNVFADQLERIIEDANSFSGEGHSHRAYRPVPDSPHIPVQTAYGIAVEGISLDQVIALWHRVRYKQYQLSGDLITDTKNQGIVYVRYQRDEEALSFDIRIDDPTADTIREALHDLAVRMLSILEPAISVRHFLQQGFSCPGTCARQNFEKAAGLAEEWVKNAPKNPQAPFYLGYALRQLLQPEQAVRALNKAVELDHRFDLAYNSLGVCLLALGRWQDSEGPLNTALGIRKSSYPEANLGTAEYHQAHFELAAEHFNRAIEIDPIAYSYQGLGLSLLRMGRYAEAVAALREAHRLNLVDFDTLKALAIALTRSGKPDVAMDEVNYTAIFLEPDAWQSYWLKGIVALEQKKPEKALLDFKQAKSPTAKILVEVAKVYRLQNQHEAAKAALDQALHLAFNDDDKDTQARAHHLLGVILAESGNVDDGLREIELAKKLSPMEIIEFPTDCDPPCN